jgi:hypothetical protein
MLPGIAENDVKLPKYYRALMPDLAGQSLTNLLQSIDTPLPQESQIDINRKIDRREFLKILEQKTKGRATIDGVVAGLTVFKSASTDGDLDAKLKTTSVVEALEYFCARTGNVWQIERSEDGVYLLIKAEETKVESGPGE